MTATIAPSPEPVASAAELFDRYDAFVDTLGCGAQAKRLRRGAARAFLDRHADVAAWMTRPTDARLRDIRRLGAWPFLAWCFVEQVVVPDVDLVAAKAKGEHYALWSSRHADDIARARAVAATLGWGQAWTHRVCANTLPLVCLTLGLPLNALTSADLDRFAAALDAAPSIGAHARQVHRAQLYGVRQVCYQLGGTDEVPRQAWRREVTLTDQVARLPQPEIRRVALRYLETVDTVLRPATVRGRAAALAVFCDWLAQTHPEVIRLDQLTRSHIEAFLVWTHGRAWWGRLARDKPISASHAAHQIVDLKTFLDDLAAWGWAERPTQTVLHRSDIPRLPSRLPRALASDVDRALMAAVGHLDDVFARCAITILRGTGLRLGELMDLELDCLWDVPDHGTWVKVPLGKLDTERLVPLDKATLAAFDTWTAQRGPLRALPHPRDRRPADFLFVAAGRRLSTKRIAKASSTPQPRPACTAATNNRCASHPTSCATPTPPAWSTPA